MPGDGQGKGHQPDQLLDEQHPQAVQYAPELSTQGGTVSHRCNEWITSSLTATFQGNYYMRNIRSEKETIPRFIRSGSFRIDSSVYVRDWNSVNLTETIFYVDIKMK